MEMTMKVARKSDGVAYDAAKHFACRAFRKITAGTDSRQLNIGISEFLHGGGAEMSGSVAERYYHVLEGRLVVCSHINEYILEKGDGIYIPPNEERAILNPDAEPCTLLVVTVNPN
jgi:quercetin dioxygenase-like cupin family protein